MRWPRQAIASSRGRARVRRLSAARRRALRPDPRSPAARSLRVQCKWAQSARRRGRRSRCYRVAARPRRADAPRYKPGEFDVFAAVLRRRRQLLPLAARAIVGRAGMFSSGWRRVGTTSARRSAGPRTSSSALHLRRAPRAHSSAGRALAGSQRSSVRARLGPPEKPPQGGFFHSTASSSGMTPRSSARGISRSSINESRFRHQLRSARRVSPSDTTRQEGVRQAGAFH